MESGVVITIIKRVSVVVRLSDDLDSLDSGATSSSGVTTRTVLTDLLNVP
jgi:hypothetical protein